MNRNFWCVGAVTALVAIPGWSALHAQTAPAKIVVSSPTVKSMEVIPAEHTADGKNIVARPGMDRRARHDPRVRPHHGRP